MASERKKIMTGATTENDVVVIKDIVKVSTSFNSYCMYIHGKACV